MVQRQRGGFPAHADNLPQQFSNVSASTTEQSAQFTELSPATKAFYKATRNLLVFTVGGVVSSYGLRLLTGIVIIPLGAALAGCYFLMIEQISEQFKKRLGFNQTFHTIAKFIIDFAFAAIATKATLYLFGLSISLFQASLATACSLIGTFILVMAYNITVDYFALNQHYFRYITL